MKNHCDESDGG